MMREDIVAVVDAWARAVAGCDVDALERLLAEPLREGVIVRTRAVHAAFADVAVTLLDVVVERDVVAWRWRLSGKHVGALGGIPGSGAQRTVEGVNFQRVRDGLVVEHWTTVDLGGLSRA
jgi:predicted ester cyclase